MKDYAVYLAGPWFSEEQKDRIHAVEGVISSHTTGMVSPRRVFICPPDADEATRRSTFLGNLASIRDAEFVVAITDGKDVGTIWEMGYAFRAGIPTVGLATTLGDRPFNLMLAESCFNTAKTMQELENIFRHYDEWLVLPPKGWEGQVE